MNVGIFMRKLRLAAPVRVCIPTRLVRQTVTTIQLLTSIAAKLTRQLHKIPAAGALGPVIPV